MKKFIGRLSASTLLMFFATIFVCQLYANEAEAYISRDFGKTLQCTLTDRKSDKTAIVNF